MIDTMDNAIRINTLKIRVNELDEKMIELRQRIATLENLAARGSGIPHGPGADPDGLSRSVRKNGGD